jgi:2-phosphoglycolate phosphatase
VTLQAVLFDLDGTLLDTAPDMGGALNELRAEHDLAPLAAAAIRPWVSNGAAALVRLGFGEPEPARFEALRQRFLELYAGRIAHETRLFEGGAALLEALEAEDIPWGIVTNKPGWLTDPLLEALALRARARTVVSGDTLPEKKPHPRPLLFAAARLGRIPGACVYLGDAERDMLAARAAGMHGVIARFGYLDPACVCEDWPSVASILHLDELLPWMRGQGLAAGPAQAAPATVPP